MIIDKIRLQLFAEEGGEPSPEEQAPEETPDKKFSQEDVDSILKKRLDREMKKFEEKLEREKSEAERLAKMSEQERLQAEFEKEKQEFENERKLHLKEKLELQTVKELSAIGLPTELAPYVAADTADDIKANIDTFKNLWEKAIDEAVNKRLQGKTPKSSNPSSDTITKESFNKMTYSERLNLYNENLELYKELTK